MKSLKDQLRGYTAPATQPPATPSKRPAASVGILETADRPLYPSLGAPAKVPLVDFPLRLSRDTVAQLKHLQSTLGIAPSALVRDFVTAGLASLERGDR